MIDIDFEYVAPAVPAPLPHVKAPTGAVDSVAAARVEKQEAYFAAAGFTAKDDFNGDGQRRFAAGTQVIESAHERLGDSRVAWEAQESTATSLEELRAKIAAEQRAVTPVPLSRIKCIGATGNVTLGKPGDGAQITRTGLGHLAQYLAPGSRLAGYLPNAPASLRADLVNYYARELGAAEEKALADWAAVPTTKSTPPAPVKAKVAVAHRLVGGTREVYRIASPSYVPFETGDAAKVLLGNAEVMAALEGSKATIKYDGERATIDVLWHADFIADLSSGDVFKAGLRIGLDEVKGGSTTVTAIAWRNLCMNMIIIGTMEKTHLRRRHIGALSGEQGLISQFLTAVKNARTEMDMFVTDWTAARRDRLLESYSGSAEDVFKGLIGAGLVDSLPGNAEAKLTRLLNSYAKEPGPSRADFVNAITRAAHEGDWWNGADYGAQQELEAEGSKLIYVKNLVGKLNHGNEAWAEQYGADDAA